LLPGHRKICLPVFEKNSAKSKKFFLFFKTHHVGETCKKNYHES
jgi:hypothetical protein